MRNAGSRLKCSNQKIRRTIFFIEPFGLFSNFGQADEEDIKSVIAYIRSLPAKESVNEKSKSDFPMSFIIHLIPQKPQFTKLPSADNKIEYGKYLVNAGLCSNCHTQQVKGEVVGKPFAGGFEFKFPDGSVLRSANITPHATGIGNWTEDVFLLKFKQYADSTYQQQKVEPGQFQTMMPWTMYSKMTDQDLRAIYAYLNTLEPADNFVEKFTTGKSH